MNPTRQTILDRLASEPHTGPELAEVCEISRVGVWKHIERLRQQGFEIVSTADGYSLESIPEFEEASIALGLDAPYELVYRECVESTNDVARSIARSDDGADVIVIADRQTAGRGRMGRSWNSERGGIYLSILLRPDIPPRDGPLLTMAAAVATAEGIAETGANPAIKWPNDVLIGSKKVAGILTEMEAEADCLHWVVVGIGINANSAHEQLPEEATSLEEVTGESIDRRLLVHAVMEAFDRYRRAPDRILPAWRKWSRTLGQRVRVTTRGEEIVGRAVDIVHPGSLTVETPDGTVTVHTGDCEHLRSEN